MVTRVRGGPILRRRVWLTFLAGLALSGPAGAQDSSTEFWPELDTYVRLSKLTRIYVSLSGTRTGDGADGDGTAGVYFDFLAFPNPRGTLLPTKDLSLAEHVLLRAGYAYDAPGGGNPATSTAVIEFSGRLTLPGGSVLSLRNRFDARITGGQSDLRYRVRERIERALRIRKFVLNPYAHLEFIYDFDQDAWIKAVATTGVEFHRWDRFVPEGYFQWNNSIGGSGADVKGWGVVVSLYLR